ncbi:MAG: hypothetical protein OMM_09528 [Candidatus Magnetoglobus multicellularis str. Araruama]|uniref:Uncharacterized protein n=1 Tax=Candidatus Magnetoglobus multicellularis str. Araruama TaxID=890399 RepID=A0A1V1P3Q5_9BACT|nr:MAG: hypothetical protein OMM_09528 [Candidatus Magnetoglobus multicellularis str. Araruama]
MTVFNHSNISAEAMDGAGGAIFIHSEHIFKSIDTQLSVTSERGNDGELKIESPSINKTNGLIALSANFLDAHRWILTPCSNRTGEKVSEFVISPRDGTPSH